jgi:glycosyl transferase family 87
VTIPKALLRKLILVCTIFAQAFVFSLALGQQKSTGQTQAVNDFVEYWAVGRLLLLGQDPYSPAGLLELQKSVGWTEDKPLIMWNPPWVASFVLPFGFLSYSAGQFAWLLLNTFLIFFSATELWKLYNQDNQGLRIVWLLAFTFLPVPLVLLFGQIGGLVLFGIVSFLRLAQRKSWLAMGAATILISIKPHPVYLFWIALVYWVIEQRKVRVAIGALVALSIATLVPVILSPNLFTQYRALFSTSAVANPFTLDTPALGRVLRVSLKSESPVIQFVPCVVGIAWFLVYRYRRRDDWNWVEELPLLLLVSVSTSAFAWSYDLIVVLPSVIQITVRLIRSRNLRLIWNAATAYVSISAIYWITKFVLNADFWSFWLPPVLFLMYVLLWNYSNPVQNVANANS